MKIVYSFLACFYMFCYQESRYSEFIKLYPKLKYDENGNFLTRSFNVKSPVDMKKEYTLISDSFSYRYVVDRDSSKLSYEYKFYNVDEDRYYQSTEPYKYYAVKSSITPTYDMVIYCFYYLENKYFYLKTFSKEGVPIDAKRINEVIYENVNTDYSYKFTLFIDNGFRIYSYSKNNDKNIEMKTKVVMCKYQIDNLGHFDLISKDSTYLEGSINNYSKFNNEPEIDDPVYRYWTLW